MMLSRIKKQSRKIAIDDRSNLVHLLRFPLLNVSKINLDNMIYNSRGRLHLLVCKDLRYYWKACISVLCHKRSHSRDSLQQGCRVRVPRHVSSSLHARFALTVDDSTFMPGNESEKSTIVSKCNSTVSRDLSSSQTCL